MPAYRIELISNNGASLVFERTGFDKNTVLRSLLNEIDLHNIEIIKITEL